MKTKVTILDKQVVSTELIPIKFVKAVLDHKIRDVKPDDWSPKNFQHIVLLAKNFQASEFDLMFCHDGTPDNGYLYLGHFNDGIVWNQP